MKKSFSKMFGKSKDYEDMDESMEDASSSAVRGTSGREEMSLDEAIDSIGLGPFQILLTFLIGFFWMTDAMEILMLSLVGPSISCEWRLAPWQQAFLTSIVFGGMAVSSGPCGWLADKFGRKIQLLFCSSFIFYFGFLSIFAPNFSWLVILRGLVGMGIGGVPQSVTLYAELTPTSCRGRGISLMSMFWSFGTIVIVIMSMLIVPLLGWRYIFAIASIPAILFIPICIWLPESPRFNLLQGRHDLVLKTLNKISKFNNKPILKKRLVWNETTTQKSEIVDLWSVQHRRTTVLLSVIWLVCAINYYGVVLMTTEIFQMNDPCHGGDGTIEIVDPDCSMPCNELTFDDYLYILWTTFAEVPGMFLGIVLIDVIGRKKSMLSFFLIFSFSIFLINMCASKVVLTVFIFIARAAIVGAFQVCFVYTPEVYPTGIRALGMGVCNTFARTGSIITPFFAQVLIRKNIYATINLYAIFGLIAALASFLLPLETKGKQLMEKHTKREEKENSTSD